MAAFAFLVSAPTVVFQSPSDGFDTFRIPALIKAGPGTLLAFAEGRQSQADAAGNRIVLRRSSDNGRSWGPLQVIAVPEGGSFNNPTAVVSERGRLLLHFQHYPQGTHEYDVEAGLTGPKSVQSYQMVSLDGGQSWSEPVNITSQVKHPEAQTLASGPGVGITLRHLPHKGRVVVPYNQRIGQRWSVYMAYSDDGGTTWARGSTVPASPEYQPNEVQVAELADGRILMNCRNQAKGKFRLSASSTDQGRTWDSAHPVPDLPDPTCQGSLLSLAGKQPTQAFSNPADTKDRVRGTFRLSFDSGATWSQSVGIESGSFQYSCLTELADGLIGILYEHTESGRYQIRFRRISWR